MCAYMGVYLTEGWGGGVYFHVNGHEWSERSAYWPAIEVQQIKLGITLGGHWHFSIALIYLACLSKCTHRYN